MAEIWSEKVRCSSKMKPKLRAEWVMLSKELCILSGFLSLMSKTSVLAELSGYAGPIGTCLLCL